MPRPSGSRIVVIGGGAAGIAAARRLHDAGQDVLLVEARQRLGGRARSVMLASLGAAPWPRAAVDFGCGWLHSARRNPWTMVAEATGMTIDRSSPNWDVQWRDLGFPPAGQAAFGAAWEQWHAAAMAALDGPDRPLSDFVAADDPARAWIDAISGFANGAALSEVSLHDWAAYERAARDENWALPEGYGTLIARHADPLPVRPGTPVTRIDRSGRTLRLETPAGTITADATIVCVPTSVIADERLAFHPPLPVKHEAAAALPLGIADKAFLHVAGEVPWPAQAHLIGDPHASCTASHRLSPFGWPIVESFFGGPCAEALEGDDAAAFAIDELVALLGTDWRRRFTPLATTRWRREAWINGSYSHARVGHAAARGVLAEAVEDRIFFAGEACSAQDFSTAHGAFATGVAAADAVLASLAAAR